jgi:WD40 repeat protein
MITTSNITIFVSIGPDNTLFFWDFFTHQPILSKELSKEPTCIKFSNNSDYLAIGFRDGELLVYRPLIRRT